MKQYILMNFYLDTHTIQKMLTESRFSLLDAFESQHEDKMDECLNNLEKAHYNLMTLCYAADHQRNTPFVLRDERELVSQQDLDKFYTSLPNKTFQVNPAISEQKIGDKTKKKQVKHPWTDDEHKLFLEALEKFGPKKLRDLTQYIKTRTLIQVRSHTQKYLLRQSKMKEKEKISKQGQVTKVGLLKPEKEVEKTE